MNYSLTYCNINEQNAASVWLEVKGEWRSTFTCPCENGFCQCNKFPIWGNPCRKFINLLLKSLFVSHTLAHC